MKNIILLLLLLCSGCEVCVNNRMYQNGEVVEIIGKKYMVIDNEFSSDWYRCRSYDSGKVEMFHEFEIKRVKK